MRAAVWVIGTSHRFQARTHWTSNSEQEQFKTLVRDAVLTHLALAIAEETSHEANAKEGVQSTICDEVSQEVFGTCALYVDPDNAERVALGIADVTVIRAELRDARGRIADAEIAAKERAVRCSDQKREREWIRRLRGHNRFPVLLVCGADHVQSFCTQAGKHGLTVEIVVKDWEPTHQG